MVRRSILIIRWIRNIQAAFLKSVSRNIARSVAFFASRSREVTASIISNICLTLAVFVVRLSLFNNSTRV